MSYPGAAAPPQGVLPNIDDPEDILRTVNYITQALTILFVTVFVVIRCYAKFRILGGKLKLDDYATYAAYVLLLGYCVTSCCASAHGGGLNQWEVSKEEYSSFSQSTYAATIFYAPMALSTKLALLIIIIRVFGPIHRKIVICMYVLVGVLVVYYVSGVFIKIFICWPISAYWTGDKGKCMDQAAVVTCDAVVSVISDLVILLLPTPLTWSLQLPRRKRLRVSALLCAGGIATAFSIYRLVMIVEEHDSENQTIVFIQVILSGNAEVGIGLICACLPAASTFYLRQTRGSSYFQQGSQDRQSGSESVHHTPLQSCRADSHGLSNADSRVSRTEEIELVPKSQLHVASDNDLDMKSGSLC